MVATAKGQYIQLKNLKSYSFEKQIKRLNSLLLNNQYEKIHYELLSLSRKELNPTQNKQISVLSNTYNAKLDGYIKKLDTDIERAISNRDNSTTTEDLFVVYESTTFYKDQFEKNGLIFSGLSPDNKLPEIIELKNHPWFVAVQFHPEFKSRPLVPHPLFSSFIKAAKNHK